MSEEISRASEGFRALGVTPEPVEAIERDGARSGYSVFGAEDGFEVAIPEHLIERMLHFGRAAAPNEWYGLLVGRLGDDARGRHVVLLGVVPDVAAAASPSYVETSHASEHETRALCRRLYPDGVIVGWVHGHHRCGARYSSTDRRNQATWKQPHALGIVVDPWDPVRLAVYRGPSSELLKGVETPCSVSCERAVRDADFHKVTRATGACSKPPPPPRRRPPRRTRVFAFVGLLAALGSIELRRELSSRDAIESLTRRVHLLESRARSESATSPAHVTNSILVTVPPALARDASTDAVSNASRPAAISTRPRRP